ncbi:hypothetical protein IKQ19_16505, partial [Candidatus Saccharibacteria bacterium]|nr:hypothetical protein [Candidatus Saccharibacteria bacterium]
SRRGSRGVTPRLRAARARPCAAGNARMVRHGRVWNGCSALSESLNFYMKCKRGGWGLISILERVAFVFLEKS